MLIRILPWHYFHSPGEHIGIVELSQNIIQDFALNNFHPVKNRDAFSAHTYQEGLGYEHQ